MFRTDSIIESASGLGHLLDAMHLPQNPELGSNRPIYRRIASGLRLQITTGKLAPGEQLPTTGELMKRWKSSSFSVNTALQTLAKEGWVESVRGAGTYVSQPESRFLCAGIYHGHDICSEKETPFRRYLHGSLVEGFRRLKKDVVVFMDTRPPHEQTRLFPPLAEAVLNRRIQCLVFPLATKVNLPALHKLGLPKATLSGSSANTTDYDRRNLMEGCLQMLARASCRSVGVMSSIVPGQSGPLDTIYDLFKTTVRKQGLSTRPEWIRKPGHYVENADLEEYGYAEFKRLWALKKKPEGLVVYPDMVARGVITAVLETGLAQVSSQMKFVFHRNAHLKMICPLPAGWAISDEDQMAAALIEQIQKQFAGEKPSFFLIPFRFTEPPR